MFWLRTRGSERRLGVRAFSACHKQARRLICQARVFQLATSKHVSKSVKLVHF